MQNSGGWEGDQNSSLNNKSVRKSVDKKKRRASKKGKKTQREPKQEMADEDYFKQEILGTGKKSSPTMDVKRRVDTHDPMKPQVEEEFDIEALEKELNIK